MAHRPLVFVTGLTAGDYLLWNWSLNGNHYVLALVAGLTLPPLAVAWVWLAAISVARLVARTAMRPGVRRRTSAARQREPEPRPAAGAVAARESTADASTAASRKMAA